MKKYIVTLVSGGKSANSVFWVEPPNVEVLTFIFKNVTIRAYKLINFEENKEIEQLLFDKDLFLDLDGKCPEFAFIGVVQFSSPSIYRADFSFMYPFKFVIPLDYYSIVCANVYLHSKSTFSEEIKKDQLKELKLLTLLKSVITQLHNEEDF